MTDIMLDLETLSTRPNAAIVVIGAIKFNRSGPTPSYSTCNSFYRRIEITSCIENKLRIDDDTVKWWKEQDKNIQYETLYHPERIGIKQALIEFSQWMRGATYVWGNGDDFDCTILGEAYKRCKLDIPWKFWNTRDCRTLFDICGIQKSDLPQDNYHHALYDCYRQLVGVKKAFNKL